jgi:hypothetical protein
MADETTLTEAPEVQSPTGSLQGVTISANASAEEQAKAIMDAGRRQVPLQYEKTEELKEVPAAAPEAKAEETATPEETPTENPLLAAIRGEAKTPAEVPEEVKSWLTKAGYEADILERVPTLVAEKTKLEQEIADLKADQAYLDELSEEAKNVIAMDREGKDWKKEVLSKPTLDWRLTFEKQDKKTLLDTYAKGKVSQEDWEEYTAEDPDPGTKRFVDAVIEGTKLLYDKDRTDVTTYRERSTKEQQEVVERFNNSLNKGLEYAYATVPGSRAYTEDIKKAITGLRDHFYEKDGVTLKPTAALDAWFVTQREAIMQAKEAKLKVEAQNAATISTLRRTEEKKPLPKGNVNGSGTEKTAEQQAQELMQSRFPGRR